MVRVEERAGGNVIKIEDLIANLCGTGADRRRDRRQCGCAGCCSCVDVAPLNSARLDKRGKDSSSEDLDNRALHDNALPSGDRGNAGRRDGDSRGRGRGCGYNRATDGGNTSNGRDSENGGYANDGRDNGRASSTASDSDVRGRGEDGIDFGHQRLVRERVRGSLICNDIDETAGEHGRGSGLGTGA
ncbi:hypothetical protein BDP55DRAFT_671090 [Colletotrichum godetiae]|uniref:Uncharacterized protein n=1 Tax=Colletotrichum godetiae TaxID=1209918 RepID=A0AAJ0EVC5_9PEZI|nr:uncharacterized protein BDP55DRAFT_671090 [Colletotrichum godetiae]KAK1673104.1 hypothetical protein BDP55DRAFT_671090 [Colletotrichum godetiae]